MRRERVARPAGRFCSRVLLDAHPGPRLPRVWSLGARRGVTHVAVVQSTQRAGTSTGGSPVAVSTKRHDKCELCRNPVPRIVISVPPPNGPRAA